MTCTCAGPQRTHVERVSDTLALVIVTCLVAGHTISTERIEVPRDERPDTHHRRQRVRDDATAICVDCEEPTRTASAERCRECELERRRQGRVAHEPIAPAVVARLREALAAGARVTEASVALGISKRTVSRYRRRFSATA